GDGERPPAAPGLGRAVVAVDRGALLPAVPAALPGTPPLPARRAAAGAGAGADLRRRARVACGARVAAGPDAEAGPVPARVRHAHTHGLDPVRLHPRRVGEPGARPARVARALDGLARRGRRGAHAAHAAEPRRPLPVRAALFAPGAGAAAAVRVRDPL